jgi:hypothetical protein
VIFFTVRRRFSLSKEANARYDAKTAYYVSLKLNKRTDTELIAALEAAPSKQSFIKEALRAYIGTENKAAEDRG